MAAVLRTDCSIEFESVLLLFLLGTYSILVIENGRIKKIYFLSYLIYLNTLMYSYARDFGHIILIFT
jgi:hypothetical protein